MSIAILGQVYDEVRRLAIAGSVVAPGDFRLKKLIPALEQAGKKAPVFAKVAEAATALIDSDEKSSATALLELTTLVNAILYTQGETGFDGEIEQIAVTDFGLPRTQTSARVLKPLLEALSTKGSGRLEVIRDAEQRGAFRDLRLIRPTLGALDDGYPEIADFIAEKVLPTFGTAIVPELQSQFDPKGLGGHVRRLKLMHQLDPAGSREHVKRSLEDGSKEVRIAAIGCLGADSADLAFLLEQAESKTKEVRAAALHALGSLDADGAVTTLSNAISGADLEIAIEPLRTSRNRRLTELLWGTTAKHFEKLITDREKDKKKLGESVQRMLLLLKCLGDRDDPETEQVLLRMFGERQRVSAIKSDPGGKDVVELLVSIMASGSKSAQAALVAEHSTLPPSCLGAAFVAACRIHSPAQVFDAFSPYVAAKVEKKRASDPQFAKSEAVANQILATSVRWHYDSDSTAVEKPVSYDRRWLKLAIDSGHRQLIMRLVSPDDARSYQVLSELFRETVEVDKEYYELVAVLEAMVRTRHPDATDSIVATIARRAKANDTYWSYWVGRFIPRLPKAEAVPKLEALLPSIPDKMADHLVDYIAELKNTK